MTKNILPLVFALVSVAPAFAAYDIGEEFAQVEAWDVDPVIWITRHKDQGFKFTSSDRSAADSRLSGATTFHGLPVYEAKLMFSPNGVSKIELSIYNKSGCEAWQDTPVQGGIMRRVVPVAAPAIDRDEFVGLVQLTGSKICGTTKLPTPQDQAVKRRNFVQKFIPFPKAQPAAAQLSWSYYMEGKNANTFRPEYISVELEGPRKAGAPVPVKSTSVSTVKNARQVKQNVVKFPDGKVYIDGVPMVDQGAKGYCAAAVSERVLKYYGLSFDEHEIAQMAGTSAGGGTGQDAMIRTVQAIGSKYGLRKEEIVSVMQGGWEKDLQQYNTSAKKLRKPIIDKQKYINGNTIELGRMWQDMIPEVRKDARCKLTGPMTKFKNAIKANVDAGIPTFWGVTLGIYPEPEIPQARGGHMRIIIGYNAKTKEILYTDTWGAGHELKRMPEDWAWTITDALFCLKPRN